MRTIPCVALLLALGPGASAGDLHGKVVCKGLRDSSDAVVFVVAVPGKAFAPPKEHAKVDQVNLTFVPRVLPVLVGTTVDFLNSDTVLHNVFSPDACCDKFNLGTWPKGEIRTYTFKKECIAGLLCKVHAEMEAFIVAVSTPYYAVTKPDGSYHIPGVPNGALTVRVWHPRLKGTQRTVTISGSTEAGFELAK